MQVFPHHIPDELASRYTADLESALLARALADTGNLPDERAKALLASWLAGTFNAAMAALSGSLADGRGDLVWQPDGDCYRLVWLAPTGLACPLARIYRQDDGTWAALVVAGVRDDPAAAMVAAEWGISRLAA